MPTPITTQEVCCRLELSEPALRHILRRPGAPRPALHPSARVFLWTEDDVDALAQFLGREKQYDDGEQPLAGTGSES